MKPNDPKRVAERVAAVLREQGFCAYLAGGCVRDALLGVEPKDYDVATDATPDQVVGLFRRTQQVGAQFGVVIVHLKGCMVEVATFRSDGDYHDGRHPESVRFVSPERDARRRDFTINGMFLDPADGTIIDYVAGQTDLRDGVIRAIGEPARRFAEDHLRMLRAVRFAATLGFTIEPVTLEAIRAHAAAIRDISVERIQQELDRILTNPARRRGWELLAESGLLDEIPLGADWANADVADVAARLETLSPDAGFMLAMAVVLRRFAPDQAASICRSLRCSGEIDKGVNWLLDRLPLAMNGDTIELADLKLLMADARFDRLTPLMRAECVVRVRSTAPHDALLARAARIPAEAVAPDPLIRGDDLQSWHVPAGTIYGQILNAVYRAQLNELLPDRDAAVRLARDLLAESGHHVR